MVFITYSPETKNYYAVNAKDEKTARESVNTVLTKWEELSFIRLKKLGDREVVNLTKELTDTGC